MAAKTSNFCGKFNKENLIDLKLLEEVRKQQSTPNATCDQVVVDLVKSMTTFPIPLPSLVDIDPDLLETLMQINFFAETWPTKMRRRRDVWSCILSSFHFK